MIDYSLSMMANPQNHEDFSKAYAHAQVSEVYDLNRFARYVADHNCKYEEEDIVAVLTAVSKRIRECLLNGRKVRLGAFGDFWLTLNSVGAKTMEAFSEENIMKVNVHFTPGNNLSNLREDAEFNKVVPRKLQTQAMRDYEYETYNQELMNQTNAVRPGSSGLLADA